MNASVVPITVSHAASFRECLNVVAREKKYLAQIEAAPLERIEGFVRESVANDSAQFVAVADGRVVGWADILEVRADNASAIKLYERCGFTREAVKRRAMRFDGIYYDSIQMSLIRNEA